MEFLGLEHPPAQALTEKEARVQSEEARQAAEHMLDKMMSEIERIKEAERRRREQEENIRCEGYSVWGLVFLGPRLGWVDAFMEFVEVLNFCPRARTRVRVLLTENNKRINEVRIQEERCRGMNIESVQVQTSIHK